MQYTIMMRKLWLYSIGMLTMLGWSCQKKDYEPLYQKPSITKLNSGTDVRLTKVQFLNENVGYVSGRTGTVLATKNAGATWTKLTINTTVNLNGLSFVDENTGWVTGNSSGTGTSAKNTVFATKDGGQNWMEQVLPGTARTMNSVAFTDQNNGWIVGNNGTIYHTTDGGDNWALQTNVDTTGMRASYVRKQMASGGNVSATAGFIGNTTLNYIHARDANTLFILANQGNVFKTTDGGATWKWQETKNLNALYGISFPRADVAYLCGANGAVLKTDGNGYFEDVTNASNTRSFRDMYFVDENYGWAFGEHGYIFKTLNGGKYWGIEVDISVIEIIYSCQFLRPDLGYLVGNGGAIIKLEDIKRKY